jgi:hypothetical protein
VSENPADRLIIPRGNEGSVAWVYQ